MAVNKVAALMDKSDIGCIIVVSKDEKPLGIITERDLVVRILAKNVKPDSLKVKTVMTTPLITISPDETINDAARIMSRLNIRRLGVIYRGELIGLISNKDILGVMPELIEIIQEKTLIEKENNFETTIEESTLAGYCDNCNAWSDGLKENNGNFICEDCRVDLELEE
jgi:signal-transduction protein with cAMP-binding, CBS, and nucleotidyltransferase domain